MLKYYNEVHSGHTVYSCDNLRLAFFIPAYMGEFFTKSLTSSLTAFATSGDDIDYDYFCSPRQGKYKHLFVVKCLKECSSFIIGFPFNAFVYSSVLHGFIEFNPNKVDMDIVQYYLNIIVSCSRDFNGKYYRPVYGKHSKVFEVKSWDLAIDIPTERANVVLRKKDKREYTRVVTSSITEYLGARKSDGSCKLYDKQEEAGLDFALTRLEVTFTSVDVVSMPTIYIFDDFGSEADLDALNDTDKVIVRLIRQLPDDEQQLYFRCLGRGKRKKLQEYIYPRNSEFKYDFIAISSVIDFVHDFEFNNSEFLKRQYSLFEQKNAEWLSELEKEAAACLEPLDDYFYAPSYDRGKEVIHEDIKSDVPAAEQSVVTDK